MWRSVRAGSEAMKADMEAEEGRRGGGAVVGVGDGEGEGQPCSGAIAIVFSTPLQLGSCGFGATDFLDKVVV